MAQPHYVSETQIMRRIAGDDRCSIRFLPHAKEQMAAREISASDILNVLTKGQVTLVESKQDVLWRALGRDIDGRKLEVVAVVDDEEIKIKVVTAF
jgi:hypothetical protein